MSSHSPSPVSRPGPAPAGLAGLHAYQVGLEFYRAALAACARLPATHLVQQLLRAAESVVLNVAEAHPTLGADRSRRFRIAADEASECGAALDLLEIRGALAAPALARLRGLLDRERAMLWRLSRPRP
jgi:four helix bundle protein